MKAIHKHPVWYGLAAFLAATVAVASVTITVDEDGRVQVRGPRELIEVITGGHQPDPGEPRPPRPVVAEKIENLGMNLAEWTDYARAWGFADAMKRARPWLIHENGRDRWGTEGEFPVDELGWPVPQPGRYPFTLLFVDMDGHYPAGAYTLTWEGTGRISVDWDATITERLDAQTAIVEVTPTHRGVYLRIDQSDPDDPVRNIRLYAPGYAPGEAFEGRVFHEAFLSRLESFSVIRFMDWGRTNGSPVARWSQRTTPAHATQGVDSGVAYEHMIELANLLQADPWLCVPHRADDDYVRSLAELVRDRLDPERTVLIEYSNEVWNGGFSQGDWIEVQAEASGVRGGSGYTKRLRWYSERSVEVFDVFTEVLGQERVVRVMGSQAANAWVSRTVLGWRDAYRDCDALAIAPYFGAGVAERLATHRGANLANALEWAAQELRTKTVPRIHEHAAIAERYGVELIAYEAGQHLVGTRGVENDERVTRLLIEANRHAWMGELTRELLEAWRAEGGGLYCAYAFVTSPSKWGSWGHLESMEQPIEDAHKFRALIESDAPDRVP